ncbi:MAG: rhodanese-like domain-containing protein [Gallionellaceae bacterium]|nr:MAG: rhodanese-like domain-containing protein [Gallionellaceae bacterium]
MHYLQDNWMMVMVFISSGLMLLWSFFGNKMRGIKEVDTVAALQLINHKEALVLDVREKNEYDAGHILNAKLIPLGKLNERVGELEKFRERPIVVMCRSGQRSSMATAQLGKQGFAQAFNLEGGVVAWQKANLPLEK